MAVRVAFCLQAMFPFVLSRTPEIEKQRRSKPGDTHIISAKAQTFARVAPSTNRLSYLNDASTEREIRLLTFKPKFTS
jgi:hypothetical protein